MQLDEINERLSKLEASLPGIQNILFHLANELDGLKCHIIMDGKDSIIIGNNVEICIPNQLSDLIQREIARTNNFYAAPTLNFLKSQLPQDAAILDIGANIGNHSLFFLSELTKSFVYAFEPLSQNFQILQENISRNGFNDRVQIHNIGLSDENTNGSIESFTPSNTGATKLRKDENGNYSLAKLDSISIDKKIDLIKIDVEGFEAFVLRGAKELIARDHPLIFVEIFQEQFQEVSGILSDYGYSLHEKFDTQDHFWVWTGK